MSNEGNVASLADLLDERFRHSLMFGSATSDVIEQPKRGRQEQTGTAVISDFWSSFVTVRMRSQTRSAVGLYIFVIDSQTKLVQKVNSREADTKQVQSDTSLPNEISEAIVQSRTLLDLPDDWDEAGSPSYQASTLERAHEFIRKNAQYHKQHYGTWITAPEIMPGPDGSIDIQWRNEDREVLVNVPTDPAAPIAYYGEDADQHPTKGALDPSDHAEVLLRWLMR